METKFTPESEFQRFTMAPWSIEMMKEYPNRVASIEPSICEMVSSLSPEETRYNAALIAAAPELYAALEAFVSVYDGMDARKFSKFVENQIVCGRAALAKARGE